MNNFVRVYTFLMTLLVGAWIATQKLAEMLAYNPRLGTPFLLQGKPYYMPWDYVRWYFQFHDEIPLAFKETNIYILGAFVIALVILALTLPKKQDDSHGSARWGAYEDLAKMELISAGGVVVGQRDNSFIRAVTGLMRTLDTLQKEKVAYAEMRFERRQDKKKDALMNRITHISQRLADEDVSSEGQKKLMQQRSVLEEELQRIQSYDPKSDVFTVYPFVALYKRIVKFHAKIAHFYLRDNSNKHLAVIAPTRSGKGVGLIIPTLLGGWKSSVIVNDIKSENWGVTAGFRKRMGHTVIKFEPTATDGSTARWNPLDEIPIGTPEEVSAAQNLAYTLADYEGKGKLDHWGSNAAVVITTVILHLKYAHFADPEHYPHPPTLYDVASFMKSNTVGMVDDEGNPVYEWVDADGNAYDNPTEGAEKMQKLEIKGFVESLEDMMNFEHVPDDGIEIRAWDREQGGYVSRRYTPEDMRNMYPLATTLDDSPNMHPIICQNFREIAAKPDNECGSIVSTANTALKEYLDPTLARNTSVSDFCVDDLMNYKRPVSLYLVTPPSDLLRLAPIFRLFFEMMVKHHAKKIGTYEGGRAKTIYKHKCLFLMDEFSSLGNLKSFASTLSYIAGYGMKVFLINQGLPQINDIYGKDNQILMNCHLQIFYAPNDNDTAKYAESLLGNKTITVESVSDSGFLSKKSYSKSQTGRALMTADEIKRLGDQEIIVASGSPPILTDKVKYYESGYFLSRLYDAPAASDIIRSHLYPERDALLAQGKKSGAKKKSPAFRPQWIENGVTDAGTVVRKE